MMMPLFSNFDGSTDLLWRSVFAGVVLIGGSLTLFWTVGGLATIQPGPEGWPQLNEKAYEQTRGQLDELPWPDWEEQGDRLQGIAINDADSVAVKLYYFLDPTCGTCIQRDRKAMAELLAGPVERREIQLMILPVFQKGINRNGLTLYRRLLCTIRQTDTQPLKLWRDFFFGTRESFWANTGVCSEQQEINQLIRWQSDVARVLGVQSGQWMLEQGKLPRNWTKAQKLIEAAIQQRQQQVASEHPRQQTGTKDTAAGSGP